MVNNYELKDAKQAAEEEEEYHYNPYLDTLGKTFRCRDDFPGDERLSMVLRPGRGEGGSEWTVVFLSHHPPRGRKTETKSE